MPYPEGIPNVPIEWPCGIHSSRHYHRLSIIGRLDLRGSFYSLREGSQLSPLGHSSFLHFAEFRIKGRRSRTNASRI